MEMTTGEVVHANIKTVAKYGGHNIKPNGSVTVSFKCPYSELPNYLQIVQMLNNDINIDVKKPESKSFGLGVFRLQKMNIDHDGECFLQFNSITDYVEVDNLNKLIVDSKDELFRITLKSEIEVEQDGEDEPEQESWDDVENGESEDEGDWDDSSDDDDWD